LLLSAYDAVSHRHWREQVTSLVDKFQWHQLSLPPRHFNWRIRGNSLCWAFGDYDLQPEHHDILLCTSMTDLASLRGFVPPLADLPTAVYCHENQFCYPGNAVQQDRVEPKITTLYTALCADILLFNSQFNHRTFMQGISRLLDTMPDHVPGGVTDRLESLSKILPVPLPDHLFLSRHAAQEHDQEDMMIIVWNHRHEHDKGPALLLQVVHELIRRNVRFRLHLLGQQFRRSPAEFAEVTQSMTSYYQQSGITPGHTGYIPDTADYHDLIARSDVVLSTADHDFQGLSLLEATALGCTPLAPARLVYPEYLDADPWLYSGTNLNEEAQAAVTRLQQWAALKIAGHKLPVPDVSAFSASRLSARWQQLCLDLLHLRNKGPGESNT